MYHEVEVSSLIIESYALGTWEACTLLEQLFRHTFVCSLELVCDTDWFTVVFFDCEGRYLEVW